MMSEGPQGGPRVFVDTSAFVANALEDDRWHDKMAQVFRQTCQSAGTTLVTTDLVLVETATLLRRVGGYEASSLFLEALDAGRLSRALEVVFVDSDLLALGREILDEWPDPGLSLTDAVSFALCRRDGIETALSLDQHFRAAGLKVLPDLGKT